MIEKNDQIRKRIVTKDELPSYIEQILSQDSIIIALCDIDFFFNINAKIGYEEGDRILRNMEQFYLSESTGQLGHYDQDSYVLVFPGAKLEDVFTEIGQIKKKQRRAKFIQADSIYHNVPIACSWGIVEGAKQEPLNVLLKKAETAVWMAKKKGRNRIEILENSHMLYRREKENFISTICGANLAGYSGDEEDAWNAQIKEPYGISVGEEGELYITDRGNHCIRKVDSNGVISTVAGCGREGYTGDNGKATTATLCKPSGVAYAKGGILYIADTGNHCIRKVDQNGIITTLIGDGTEGKEEEEHVTKQVCLSRPGGVAADWNGYIYTNDYGNNRVLKIDEGGHVVETYGNPEFGYAGDGEDFSAILFNKPYGVTVAKNGSRIYVPDFGNRCVRCIDAGHHKVSTIFQFASFQETLADGGVYWVEVWRDKILCVVDGENNRIILYDMEEEKIRAVLGEKEYGYLDVASSQDKGYFNIPAGVAIDEKRCILYVADYANNAVRRVDLSQL